LAAMGGGNSREGSWMMGLTHARTYDLGIGATCLGLGIELN